MSTVIYCRISMDAAGEELGVGRQERECRQLCEKNDWSVDEVLIDNDISATKGLRRPAFEELLEMKPERVVVWHTDRLVRVTKDLERVIELGVPVHAAVAGTLDLSTPTGRAVARTVTAWATYEGEQKAERQRSAARQRAEAGSSWWPVRPFGLELDGRARPDEAALVAQAYRDVLNGASVTSIAREWREAGVKTPRGNDWTQPTLRQLLLNPRNAGIRMYEGEEVGEGKWDALVGRTLFHEVRRLFNARRGGRSGGGPRRYLLTKVAVCGECGGEMKVMTRKRASGSSYRIYVCRVSHCASAPVEPLDAFVEGATYQRMEEHAEELLAQSTGEGGEAEKKVDELNARAAELHEAFAEGGLSVSGYRGALSAIEERLGVAEARLRSTRAPAGLDDAPGRLLSQWTSLDVDAKRVAIEWLTEEIVIRRRGKGANTFNPREHVDIEWA